jgi:predicted O-methyltransferase YrrM
MIQLRRIVRRFLAPHPTRSLDPKIARYLALRKAFDRAEGWCADISAPVWDAMLVHQRDAGVRGDVLEIGVYRGKSAVLLAGHVDPQAERFFLVDPRMDEEEVRRTLERARPDVGPALRFLHIESVEVVTSEAVSTRGRLRWVHIDGSHATACVLADLASAHDLLAADGIAVLDDFFDIGYPHLTEAVFRYLGAHSEHFTLFLAVGNKGYLARPRAAPAYRHYCLHSLVSDLEARGVEMALWKSGLAGELDCFALKPREFVGQRLRGIDDDPTRIYTDTRGGHG